MAGADAFKPFSFVAEFGMLSEESQDWIREIVRETLVREMPQVAAILPPLWLPSGPVASEPRPPTSLRVVHRSDQASVSDPTLSPRPALVRRC